VADSPNALAGALDRVGDRWSLLVVDALIEGPRRFGDLEDDVAGIATNVLSERLRRLEADGILIAVPYTQRPVRYAYQLTEAGRELAGAIKLLAQWSADHGGGEAQTAAHNECGTPLVARWWCPTCDVLADGGPLDGTWV
jgi:DNA-binding HxlR family transcriptional regulator